ncbi:phosphatidylinositol-3,4-bisphosphate 4-phosphatase [Aureococcus anophagefferens]|nr:phosphatidylinositol-3,4-bisphosphate 4-phosphatase [Aureococcus anophagefferens]
MRLQARSPADRDRWVDALRSAIAHATREDARPSEPPAPPAPEGLAAVDLDDDDDDDDDGPAPPLPCAITPEKIEAAVRRGGTSELRAGAATGLQATLHLKGARVDRMDEDGLFVVAFRCDDEAWDEVARTEVVKAGASGAFASESSDPRGGLDVVRHFSVLLPASVLEGPCGFAVYMKHGHAAPLASHRRLFRTRLDGAEAPALAGRSRGAVLDVPLHREEQAQPDDDEDVSETASSSSGTANALAAPSRGSVAVRRVPARGAAAARARASPAATSGRLLLCGVDGAGLFAGGGGAAPYARRHYHLRSAERDGAGVRYGHVVAAETIAVPAAAGDLPAALLGLLAAERRSATRRGAAGAAPTKRSAVATLRRKARLAAGDAAERRHRSDDDAAAARFSHLDRDEDDTAGGRGEIDRRARTPMRSRELDFAATKIEAIADQLAAMRDELEAQAAHADDVYASGRARALDLRVAAPFPESPGGVAAVENPLARGGHRLKRSTLKKDAALQFLPTNLNWHQRRGASRPPARRRADALAVAAAHVEAALRCAAEGSPRHARALRRALAGAGGGGALLLGVECLLSTHGDELGMLEDLVAATEWMDSLTFAFVDRPRGAEADNAAGDWAVSRRPGGGGALLVERRVDGPLLAACRAAGPPGAAAWSCGLDAVLFSQGINLCARRARGRDIARARRDARARRADAELAAWAAALRGAVAPAVADGTPGKNVHVLLHSSDLLRDLAGSHAICCKSGKDRTAMAVTLEQTRALSRDLRVFDERMLCKLLRAHGVRRRNLLLNTGQDRYAFNAVQVKSLPVCYRPPAGTYTGNALT